MKKHRIIDQEELSRIISRSLNSLGICLMSIIFFSILSSCNNEQSDPIDSYFGPEISVEELEEFILERKEHYKIPGLSIAFVNNSRIKYYSTFGYSNKEKRRKVENTTIFEAASLSKPVFASFVMTYVDQNRLDLDKPLFEYLPYPDIEYDSRYKKITARMVLSHRTGFPNWRTDRVDKKLVIEFEPNTNYQYSGEGYQYLALVLKSIEECTWRELDDKFQKRIAIPSGMRNSTFLQNDNTKNDKAEAYDENGNWISPQLDTDSILRYQFRSPASLHSEAIDFSKWMIMIMERNTLSEKSHNELFTTHSYVGDFSGIPLEYTLGFFSPQAPFTDIFLHGGNNYGFTSFFAMDPSKKWGFVLFTNSEFGEQFGTDLLIYSLVGPNQWILIIPLIIILILLFLAFRYAIKLFRRSKI